MQFYLFVLLMLFHFIHYNIFEQKANDTCYESYSKHHKCNCEVAAFYVAPQNRGEHYSWKSARHDIIEKILLAYGSQGDDI